MPAEQVQRRRGTEAQHSTFTGAVGEITVDTTNNNARVHDGVTVGGHIIPNARNLQTNKYGYAAAGGGADALTVTLAPPLAAYVDGAEVKFRATLNNTGAATVNVNGLGAAAIKKAEGGAIVDLAANNLVADMVYTLIYSSAISAFCLVSGAPASVGVDPIGEGQTWSNPSVGNNINYTNTTGRAIMIAWSAIGVNPGSSPTPAAQLQVGATAGSLVTVASAVDTTYANGSTITRRAAMQGFAIVPPGYVYRFNTGAGSWTNYNFSILS